MVNWCFESIVGSKLDKVFQVQRWIVAVSAPGVRIWDFVFGLNSSPSEDGKQTQMQKHTDLQMSAH